MRNLNNFQFSAHFWAERKFAWFVILRVRRPCDENIKITLAQGRRRKETILKISPTHDAHGSRKKNTTSDVENNTFNVKKRRLFHAHRKEAIQPWNLRTKTAKKFFIFIHLVSWKKKSRKNSIHISYSRSLDFNDDDDDVVRRLFPHPWADSCWSKWDRKVYLSKKENFSERGTSKFAVFVAWILRMLSVSSHIRKLKREFGRDADGEFFR